MIDFDTVDLAYHQQDKDMYCGAAVAQMVLDQLGCGLEEQSDLYGQMRERRPGYRDPEPWYTSPDGLARVLRAKSKQNFTVCTDHLPAIALARAVHRFEAARFAVPTLVMADHHWVTINGFAYRNEQRRIVRGLFLNDPAPVTAIIEYGTGKGINNTPPPHQTDDWCGHGWIYGFPNAFATPRGWLRNYWREPSPHAGGYVTVPVQPVGSPIEELELETATDCVRPTSELIGSNQAASCAYDQIANLYGLDRKGPLAGFLAGFRTAPASLQSYAFWPTVQYYGVWLMSQKSAILGYAKVDPYSGALLEVRAAQEYYAAPGQSYADSLRAMEESLR